MSNKRIDYTPSYIQELGSSCFAMRTSKAYVNSPTSTKPLYRLFEARTELSVHVMTGKYIGNGDRSISPNAVVPDYPEFVSGFPTLKDLKHYYDVLLPKDVETFTFLKTHLDPKNIDRLLRMEPF